MLNNLIVLIILHYTSIQCKIITLYTLNLHNLMPLYLREICHSLSREKQSKIFVIYIKCFFLLKYNFFQFLYTGLLGITVPNSERERTRNQQMSFPNCPQMCFSVNFTQLFFFFLHISTAFFTVHFQPLMSLQYPLGLILFTLPKDQNTKYAFFLNTNSNINICRVYRSHTVHFSTLAKSFQQLYLWLYLFL